MKGGCIRTKVVLFAEKWFYSGKSGFIRVKVVLFAQSGSNQEKKFSSGNLVLFGQKLLYLGKVVVFGQKWL